MATIRNLDVSLRARTKKFEQGMKRASMRVKKFGSVVGGVAKRLAGFGSILTGVSVGSFAVFAKLTADNIDSMAKFADRIGIGVDKLAALEHGANLTGVGINNLRLGLQRMTRRVSEAAQGTGEAQKALAELGVDAKALNSLSPDEQFKELAEAMESVSNQSDRVRLAMRLFDSEGVALVNTMKGGRAALEGFEAEARKLGLTFSRDAKLWASSTMSHAPCRRASAAVAATSQTVPSMLKVPSVTTSLRPSPAAVRHASRSSVSRCW